MNYLFRKYQPLLVSLTEHQLFRDYLGFRTLKIPSKVDILFPSGHIKILERHKGEILLAQYTGVPGPVYGHKLYSALRVLDMASSFLSSWKEAQKLVMGELDLISGREFLPLLLRLPRFASYSRSPGYNSTIDGAPYADIGRTTWAAYQAAAGNGTGAAGSVGIYHSDTANPNAWATFARYVAALDLTECGIGAVISGTPLYTIYPTSRDITLSGQSIRLTTSTMASTSAVVAGDYARVGTVAQAGDLTIAGLTLNATNDFSFNATGITTLQNACGGIVKLGARIASDADNSEPSVTSGQTKYAIATWDYYIGGHPAILSFTYTPVAKGARIINIL